MTFQVGCKLSLVFFQYCIMANFYWLLVEGLYLHTLLVAIFSPSRRFPAYLLIGWGKDASPCCPPCARALHTPSATPRATQLPGSCPLRSHWAAPGVPFRSHQEELF